jgi:hypothetical protein
LPRKGSAAPSGSGPRDEGLCPHAARGQDIDDICDSIANDSLEAANRLLAALDKAISGTIWYDDVFGKYHWGSIAPGLFRDLNISARALTTANT